MTFAGARDFAMPFGKYKGQTIWEVAGTDEWLRYLDWLVGQNFVSGRFKDALKVYLSDPSIAKEVELILR